MNFLSVCSGIEAASVAWNPLGWRACMVSEIEPFPISVLRHRHGAHDLRTARPAGAHLPLWGDFTALRVRHFRRFGIPLPAWLVGGTPCQAFSVAGKRGSLDDARGNLSLAFIRLAHALAATGTLRGLLWENVPGVLSTRDNAFGCFLGELVGGGLPLSPPRGGSWPRAGMVSGPRARAAWRVLDAQYFGLAQRRERVFVVGSFGDGPDPAAVLFERQGLRGDTPPRREAGARPAASLGASSGGSDDNDARGGHLIAGIHADAIGRSGDPGTDVNAPGLGISRPDEAMFALSASAVHGIAFGGNDTRGPIDIATALNAHGGPTGRLDVESETFIVSGSLMGSHEWDGIGREDRHVACDVADTLTVGKNQTTGFHGEVVATLDASYGRLQGCSGQDANHGHSHLVPVAFDCKAGGNTSFAIGPIAGALRGEGFGGGHAAVAFHENQRGELTTSDTHAALSGGGGKPGQGYASASTPSGVRRLIPRECERLQGFSDDYTLVPHRGKPASDGPRYKALGNSKAVPVVRWIGARIALALAGDAA